MVDSRGEKYFENGHTKLKLLRFEVESGDCGKKNQGIVELNSITIELE